jgi:hypothetical protein
MAMPDQPEPSSLGRRQHPDYTHAEIGILGKEMI